LELQAVQAVAEQVTEQVALEQQVKAMQVEQVVLRAAESAVVAVVAQVRHPQHQQQQQVVWVEMV
jgi:hypothetical protein